MITRSTMRRLALVAVVALAGAAGGCAATKPKPDAAYLASGKLARELVARGDWERAFSILDELHRQQPDDAEVLTLRGIVYRERGLYADAETDLKAALAATPNSPETHAALGILYDVQLRQEAEAQHREAVRLAPNNAAYLNNLGFSLYLRQHFKEAIAEYEKAARLAPLSHRVRTNLGFACAATGDLRRAAREFRMGGSESEAMNNLGFAYERRGELTNAYDAYLAALRLDPAAGKARSNLVHAATVLGRPLPTEAQVPVAAAAVPPSSEAAAPSGAPEATMEGPSEAPAAAPVKLDAPAAAPAKAAAPLKSTPAVLAPQSPQPKAKP
jgi:Flp pilus assembly protein TadD